MTGEIHLQATVGELDALLRGGSLTAAIGRLERALEGAGRPEATFAAESAGVTADLLAAALTVRARLRRIDDLVHAAGIALALPRLLDVGGVIPHRVMGSSP